MNQHWQIGDKIENRWEIHKILKGGMGVVYIVYDQEKERALATKTYQDQLFAEDSATARFEQEALAWIALDIHQNVTYAEFVYNIEGKPFLFLEYVSGGDLSSWIGTPRLTADLPQVLHFAIQFCDGMIHALSKGIKAHRDIKPQNCLITHDGTLKVTDFGLAKVLDGVEFKSSGQSSPESEDLNILVSRTGSAAGTPPYMAPEQFDDVKHVDVRADIYSFGVMLFQMIEGRLPFVARSFVDFKRLHTSESPPPLTTKESALAILVERCLAKEPAQRFANFTVIRKQLAEIYEGLTGHSASRPATGGELDAIGLTNKGASLSELGHAEEAVDCYDRAIALKPDYAAAHYNKGVTLKTKLGRDEEAIACFDRAMALTPNDADAHYAKGATLRGLGRHKAAIACYDRAIGLKPDFAEAYYNKGNSLAELGRSEDAIACYDRAIGLKPDFAEALYGRGVTLGALGRREEAIDCYDRAIALEPQEAHYGIGVADAHYAKGATLRQLGRHEEAIECFDRVIALKPDEAAAHYAKGFALQTLGRYEEAIECYDRAIALNPADAKAYRSKGYSLAQLGRCEEAVESYDRSIALNPDDAATHFNKGVALWELRRLEDSIYCYDRVIALKADDANGHYFKGVILKALGRHEEAIECYDRAIALNPDDAKVHRNKGIALATLGRFEEAIDCFDRAIALKPDVADVYNDKGVSLEILSRCEQAVAAYQKAQDLGYMGAAERIEACRQKLSDSEGSQEGFFRKLFSGGKKTPH